jgi:xanthine/CO dehydrogenase XdhC/CoxF family maturation factor
MRKGRPQIGEQRREVLAASVSAEIAALVRQASDRSGLSRSQLISMALEAYGHRMRALVERG